jgi:hypothetical protein
LDPIKDLKREKIRLKANKASNRIRYIHPPTLPPIAFPSSKLHKSPAKVVDTTQRGYHAVERLEIDVERGGKVKAPSSTSPLPYSIQHNSSN